MNSSKEEQAGLLRKATEEVFSELQILINHVKHIKYIQDDLHLQSNLYTFTLLVDVTSLTSRSSTHDRFLFKITVYEKTKKDIGVKIKLAPKPFNPYFDEDGIWISPSGINERISTTILRIIHSLQYEDEYIYTPQHEGYFEDAITINRDALNWYINSQKLETTAFPIKSHEFPHQIEFNQKKFSIAERTFSIKNESLQQPVIKKKFNITSATPTYAPIEKPIPNLSKVEPSSFRSQSSNHELYISKSAKDKIFRHISWGDQIASNIIEQGGILLGEVYIDKEINTTYGIVEIALSGESATASNVHLEMGHDTWKRMIDHADEILESLPEKKLQIIGWYHTHPNHLDVFMSGTDKATQSRLFSQDWHFAIVLNPQRKIWRAFHGKESLECKGYMLSSNPNIDTTTNEDIEDSSIVNAENIQTDPNDPEYDHHNHNIGKHLLISLILILMLGLLVVTFNMTSNTKAQHTNNNQTDVLAPPRKQPANIDEQPKKQEIITLEMNQCLRRNKIYIFTSKDWIIIYDINNPNPEEVLKSTIGSIKPSEQFQTGVINGRIPELSTYLGKKWLYITSQNKKGYIQVDDLEKYAICLQ